MEVKAVADGKWHYVGYCDVDAGMIWIGDPCYILSDKRDNDPGYDYMELVDSWPSHQVERPRDQDQIDAYRAAAEASGVTGEKLEHFVEAMSQPRTYAQHAEVYPVPHEVGHEGRGICVESGLGDGTYPVYVKFKDEGEGWGIRVSAVYVSFLGEKPDGEIDFHGHEDSWGE